MPAEPLPLHEAIAAAIGDRSQTELAEQLDVGQSNISKWMRGVTRPSLDDLVRLEEVCGRRRGFILKAAGYIEESAPSTAEAIQNDPRLDDLGRRIVLASYEAALNPDRQR